MSDLVVLMHGLGRGWRSMRRLETAVQAAGHETLNWDYPGRAHTLDDLVGMARAHLVHAVRPGQRVHAIGHSLGAILARGALGGSGFDVGRVVMIAPPNQGVALIGQGGRARLARWLYGRPAPDLAADHPTLARLPVLDAEIGVIAGTRRFHPLNPTAYLSLLGMREPHDGTVAVARTRLAGMTDFIMVSAHHTFIGADAETVRQTLHFLAYGRFDHEAVGRR